ncbi:hypothetical protein [Streptomyces sp. H27-C3]|uniref:hypothetical protein n=1 Tax=Streptomyces sp. H27-C3 TaxID=3046305 RepID=UPI0024BB71DE|nr:hypothetical protein [Streptomyces sp. H27-C3]MDJ0464298.1 hypothetical protein [Streptomyces sp. H27-C3]
METEARQKRTGLLALGVLGFLMIAVLVVFTVFDGDDDETPEPGAARPAASSTADDSPAGDEDSEEAPAGSGASAQPGPTPIVPLTEVGEAHQVMTRYMAGISTYDHTSTAASWGPPLFELTSREAGIKETTALPSGKAWAECRQERCSSRATAVATRDALVSDDLTRGSGRTISTVVKVDITRKTDDDTQTESNTWLVSARYRDGAWQVTGFDIFGLGNIGSSGQDEQ